MEFAVDIKLQTFVIMFSVFVPGHRNEAVFDSDSVGTEIRQVFVRKKGRYTECIAAYPYSCDTGNNKIAESGVIVVVSSVFVGAFGNDGMKYLAGKPFAGERIKVFVNKGALFFVFCYIVAGSIFVKKTVIV